MSEDDTDIHDRYAARFEADADAEADTDGDLDADDDQADREQHAGNATSVESVGNAGNVWNAGNVKSEWKGWTVYLPEPFLDHLQDQAKLADVRLDREVRLDRHFKPALVALGLERMERMEDQELAAFIDRMERGEIDY